MRRTICFFNSVDFSWVFVGCCPYFRNYSMRQPSLTKSNRGPNPWFPMYLKIIFSLSLSMRPSTFPNFRRITGSSRPLRWVTLYTILVRPESRVKMMSSFYTVFHSRTCSLRTHLRSSVFNIFQMYSEKYLKARMHSVLMRINWHHCDHSINSNGVANRYWTISSVTGVIDRKNIGQA